MVGHCHPAVVEAVSAQLATLNTNSRYLQQSSVELAERLLSTLPERFERVLLVNSGSEANDLAWRIARHATGNAGGIATRFAYHGITEAAFAFSPEGWGAAAAPGFMRLVEPPPTTASGVGAAVHSLAEADVGVAAMLVDGVFTSDGIRGPAHAWTRRLPPRPTPEGASTSRTRCRRATDEPGTPCGASWPETCPPTW